MTRVSVVIPCYRSSKTIGSVVNMTRDVLLTHGYDYQFVLVNDCSGDDTFDVIAKLANEDERITSIDLAKNVGQNGALFAALHYVDGELVMGMDDDMQTHPSQIPILLDAIGDEVDLVYGVYGDQHYTNAIRHWGSVFQHWIMRFLMDRPKGLSWSSFWVSKRYLVDEAVCYRGPSPQVSTLLMRSSSYISNVVVEHHDREYGSSGYTLKTLMKTFMSGFGYSLKPLKLFSLVGCTVLALGLALQLLSVLFGINPTGIFGSLSFPAFLCVLGVALLLESVAYEYMGLLYQSSLGFSPYIIRRIVKSSCTPTETAADDNCEKR